MVNIKQGPFKTREEAEKWKTSYLNRYPTPGYGTTLRIVEDNSMFLVVGDRFSSCD